MSHQPSPQRLAICPSEALSEGRYLTRKIRFEGRDDECLVVRFNGKVYAYINRCVHMPRRLDCEENQVFDHSGRYLRCSMHGIVYTPETGTSISAMCEGDQLRAIAVYEEDGEVGLADYRVGYFGISEYYRPIPELDERIRRRIRMGYWKQWRWPRTKIKHLLALGVSLKTAIQHGVSSKSYWRMARTPAMQQALNNDWLKAKGLLSIKTLWCKAQGYSSLSSASTR